ncbi:2175_t:CDS:2 [Gigaspora rosea]|nr:2175_t:CDS:2 [Gigaspora rosea]
MFPYQRRRNDWLPSIIFYECDIIKLNENVANTLTDKWSGHRKPYISQNLNEILLLPKEQPSLLDIKDTIQCEFRKIEKKIEELPVLKQDIKELKESIEDMKTNK